MIPRPTRSTPTETLFPLPTLFRSHAADKAVKHLDRGIGKSGLKVDHCGRQRRPPAIDAVIRKQECRCHAALADKLGKAEFRNGAPNYRVDTYAANIAQALKQAIDIGRSRGFFEITPPRQRRSEEHTSELKSLMSISY